MKLLLFSAWLTLANANTQGEGERTHHRLQYPCTLLIEDAEYEDPALDDTHMSCELDPRDADGRHGVIVSLEGFRLEQERKSDGGELIYSGREKFDLTGAEYNPDTGLARLPVGESASSRIVREPGIQSVDPPLGTKRVLVIRPLALDSNTTASAEEISDHIFGTFGRLHNLRTQYQACSHGKFEILPAEGVENGVLEVPIGQNVSGLTAGNVRGLALPIASEMLGYELPGELDHIIFCMPPGTNGNWIATAFVNHWMSQYNNNWCLYLTAQMHEVGHNLNLGHSGEGNNKYGDRSSNMGVSYQAVGGPRMCFNAPKNWQLGWYADRHIVWTPPGPTLVVLRGVADYVETTEEEGVLLQIPGVVYQGLPEDYQGELFDYYVSFNRQSGVNAGSNEGQNNVLVHGREAGDGTSISWLQVKMVAGDEHVLENGVVIEVLSIDNKAVVRISSPDSATSSTFDADVRRRLRNPKK